MDDKISESFTRLWDVICTVREKCPWDQRQTLETLAPPFLEEAYEALEAVEIGEASHITEELGDIFFMALMLIRIAEQEGFTSPARIFDEAAGKLIARHPHVYGKSSAGSAEDVVVQWEELKKQEKIHRSSVFDGIPKALPPSMRLQKILKKSAALGFNPPLPESSGAKERLRRTLLELYTEGADINSLISEIARDCEREARSQGL